MFCQLVAEDKSQIEHVKEEIYAHDKAIITVRRALSSGPKPLLTGQFKKRNGFLNLPSLASRIPCIWGLIR